MKTPGVFFMLLLLCTTTAAAQTSNKPSADPDRLFAIGNYGSALPYFLKTWEKDSLNPKLNYKVGYCYLQSRSLKRLSVKYLERSVRVVSDGSDYQSPVAAYKHLADAYHINHQFDLAIVTYEKYLKLLREGKTPDETLVSETEWKIALCRIGKELKRISADYSSAGAGAGSLTGRYATAMTPDELTVNITFKNSGKHEYQSTDQMYFESVLLPAGYNAGKYKQVPKDSLKPNLNEATLGTSVDGQIILTYRVTNGNADLYISRLNGNRWGAPQRLDEAINTAGWEDSECIAADGQTLFFVSDRPGGFGGKDIYKSRLLSDGTWSKGQNLGATINTAFDEEAPFIHPDGRTLYFSSNGYRTAREFDIYTSQVNENGIWSKPINTGYPMDTTKMKEPFPLMADNGKEEGSAKKGKEKSNYQVTFLNDKGAPLNVLRGEVVDQAGTIPAGLKITVSDNDTYEISGTYFPANGHYSLILPRGRNNNIAYEVDGYLFHSENIDLTKNISHYDLNPAVSLTPVKENASVVLKNVFFEEGKSTLLQSSGLELKKVTELMNRHPEMTVSLNAYVISEEKNNVKFNGKLAEKRAKTVADYLVSGGIAAARIEVSGSGKAKASKDSEYKTDKSQAGPKEWIELKIEKMK